VTRQTEVVRAASVAAPANVTTQRPAATPPPGNVAIGTTPPPGSTPPANAVVAMGTAAPVKTQWTGQLVVPTEGAPAHGPRSKAPLLIGAGIVVAGAAIAAALVLKGGGGGGGGNTGSAGSNIVAGPSGSGSGSAQTTVVDAGVAAVAPLPAEVFVTIDATPKNAEIVDFDHNKATVGRAGQTFRVDPGHDARHYLVRATGYVDELVEIVPDQHDVKQTVQLKRGTGTVSQLPKVDAGVAAPTVDAAVQVTIPVDAAVQVVAPVDAAVAVPKPPDDDCEIPPCIKAFPGSNK
jgi:hypothetical protein